IAVDARRSYEWWSGEAVSPRRHPPLYHGIRCSSGGDGRVALCSGQQRVILVTVARGKPPWFRAIEQLWTRRRGVCLPCCSSSLSPYAPRQLSETFCVCHLCAGCAIDRGADRSDYFHRRPGGGA